MLHALCLLGWDQCLVGLREKHPNSLNQHQARITPVDQVRVMPTSLPTSPESSFELGCWHKWTVLYKALWQWKAQPDPDKGTEHFNGEWKHPELRESLDT